jgi:hypothetical protein
MSKHFNLIPFTSPKYKRWQLDYDYIGKLKRGLTSKNEKYRQECQEALDYLDKFTGEFYKGNFDNNPLHPEELKKDCYNRNNANQRDMMSYHYQWNDLIDVKEVNIDYIYGDNDDGK